MLRSASVDQIQSGQPSCRAGLYSFELTLKIIPIFYITGLPATLKYDWYSVLTLQGLSINCYINNHYFQ